MKNIQKFIIPGLVVFVVVMLYFSYFAPSDELGSFTKFDTNNNASLPIIVKYVKEKGAQRSSDGSYSFYVIDADNTEMLVYGLRSLPPGMDDSKSIVVTGHLSGKDSFHAHGVELRN